MTFSMCCVRSASRCSMCSESVQMRLATSCSSKSARCMKAEKFSPRPDRIDDREADLAGRHRGQQPQHGSLQRLDRLGPACLAGLQQEQRMIGQRQQQRQRELRSRRLETRVVGNAAADLGQLHVDLPEADGCRRFAGRRPRWRIGGVPVGKQPLAVVPDDFHRFDEAGDPGVPSLGHLVPFPLVLGLAGGEGLLAGLAQGGRLGR